MTSCEFMQAAALDEALPRPEGFEAHVASCEQCRAVVQGHRAAVRLRGSAVPAVPRRSISAVKRRASVVAALGVAVVGAVSWWQLSVIPHPGGESVLSEPGRGQPEPSEVSGQQVVNATPAPEAELLALAALNAAVLADVARDPREDETLRRVFGSLPRWTAPTRTNPVRSLGRAASPVVFTSEDSP